MTYVTYFIPTHIWTLSINELVIRVPKLCMLILAEEDLTVETGSGIDLLTCDLIHERRIRRTISEPQRKRLENENEREQADLLS